MAISKIRLRLLAEILRLCIAVADTKAAPEATIALRGYLSGLDNWLEDLRNDVMAEAGG